MEEIFRQICGVSVEEDGLAFDKNSVQAERIREEAGYEGIRMHIEAHLGKARIRLQVDIGFGDVITPRPTKKELPAMLDFTSPQLLVCPWETMIAEKYQAIVALGMANSRMKDFFDLRFMASQFSFEGSALCKAIEATSKRRETELPSTVPTALSPTFSNDMIKQNQWIAFLRRSRLGGAELSLAEVTAYICRFLKPPTDALINGNAFEMSWPPRGPWQP